MKKLSVSILALFSFAAIAASTVLPSSQAKPSVNGKPTYTEMIMGILDYTVEPDKTAKENITQDNNVEAAKRFAGTWKGKPRPDAITDAVIILKMEGVQLKGTIRQTSISRVGDGEPQIVRDEYVPLPDLSVEGKTLTWKEKWIQPGHEVLRQVTLISDDEILFESVGTIRSDNQPTLILPMSYKLRREK